jgi:hypothetical protein
MWICTHDTVQSLSTITAFINNAVLLFGQISTLLGMKDESKGRYFNLTSSVLIPLWYKDHDCVVPNVANFNRLIIGTAPMFMSQHFNVNAIQVDGYSYAQENCIRAVII